MKINIPPKVEFIIERLMEHGYEAYAVGGCVRDSILKRIPDDWDITTSASPYQVKDLFPRTIDTGIKHGTVTVMLDKEGFEVTTYRIDGEYEDNRHPKRVEFTANLGEDLARRDFTINALAYNPLEGIVDKFDGMGDIKRRIIRCVGNAEERFDEDALRILRTLRFSAQLDFCIDKDTRKALGLKSELLKNISAERIRIELEKILLSVHPEKLIEAYELGITKIILPEFDDMMQTEQNNPHHCYSVGIHAVTAVRQINKDSLKQVYSETADYEPVQEKIEKWYAILRWTMLLHDVGKPYNKTTSEDGTDHFYGHPKTSAILARKILRRLKLDNETIELASHLALYHDYQFGKQKASMRRAINKIGDENMPLLFEVKRADILAQAPEKHKEKLEGLKKSKVLYRTIKENKECVNLKMLEISGRDLIEAGFKQGKEMGGLLNLLLDIALEDPLKNRKDILLMLAKEMKNKCRL